jgi:hypothetical protein
VDEPFIYERARSTSVTGTVKATIGTKIVTQDGTFTHSIEEYLQLGDSITINSENHIIAAISPQITPTPTMSTTIATKIVKQDASFDEDFTTDLTVGDPIIINSEVHTIASIQAEDFIAGRAEVTKGSKVVTQSA